MTEPNPTTAGAPWDMIEQLLVQLGTDLLAAQQLLVQLGTRVTPTPQLLVHLGT